HVRRAHHRHLPRPRRRSEPAPAPRAQILSMGSDSRQVRMRTISRSWLATARPAHAAGPSGTLARMRLVPQEAVERERRKLFLLDGHSLAYRAFFALPPTLATTSGTVTNAVYGFTSMLIKLLAEERPDLIAVA